MTGSGWAKDLRLLWNICVTNGDKWERADQKISLIVIQHLHDYDDNGNNDEWIMMMVNMMIMMMNKKTKYSQLQQCIHIILILKLIWLEIKSRHQVLGEPIA